MAVMCLSRTTSPGSRASNAPGATPMPKRVPTARTHAPRQRPCDSTEARKEAKRFYASTAWRKLRRYHLAGAPLCVDCQAEGRLTPAEHVHHKVKRSDAPTLALD